LYEGTSNVAESPAARRTRLRFLPSRRHLLAQLRTLGWSKN